MIKLLYDTQLLLENSILFTNKISERYRCAAFNVVMLCFSVKSCEELSDIPHGYFIFNIDNWIDTVDCVNDNALYCLEKCVHWEIKYTSENIYLHFYDMDDDSAQLSKSLYLWKQIQFGQYMYLYTRKDEILHWDKKELIRRQIYINKIYIKMGSVTKYCYQNTVTLLPNNFTVVKLVQTFLWQNCDVTLIHWNLNGDAYARQWIVLSSQRSVHGVQSRSHQLIIGTLLERHGVWNRWKFSCVFNDLFGLATKKVCDRCRRRGFQGTTHFRSTD